MQRNLYMDIGCAYKALIWFQPTQWPISIFTILGLDLPNRSQPYEVGLYFDQPIWEKQIMISIQYIIYVNLNVIFISLGI